MSGWRAPMTVAPAGPRLAGPKSGLRSGWVSISVLSPSGQVLFSQPQTVAERDASFYPMRYVPGVASLTIKPKTAPGDYTLLITVRDAIGQRNCESRAAFRIE